MTAETVAIIERLFKAAIFIPMIGLVAWWLFASWLDRTLSGLEAGIGLALTAGACLIGIGSIIRGGWGFLGIMAVIFIAVLGLAVWQYVYWRRRDRKRLLDDLHMYELVIDQDPTNAAAYSFLGETHLKLRNFPEAAARFQKALELDPESRRDRKMLQWARQRRAHYPWTRLD